MIFNIIVALCTGFMTIHSANTIKEDYKTPLTDCKVWGFEDGGVASKVRWASKIGLDTVSTATSGLTFADAVSGGNIRTKAIRDLLGGFESGSDLKEKYSKLTGYDSTEKQSLIKENSSMNQPSNLNEESNISNNDGNIVLGNEPTAISSTDADNDSNAEPGQDGVTSEIKETEVVSNGNNIAESLSMPSANPENDKNSN